MIEYIAGLPLTILAAWLFTRFLTWLAKRNPLPDKDFKGRELRHRSRRWRGMR